MPRKQCACGCGEWFSGRARQKFLDDGHYRRSAYFIEQVVGGMRRALLTKRATPVRLAGFGELTAREQAIYQRARTNALTYSRAKVREEARRQAWAEALGEPREGMWRKRRAA